MLYDKALEAPDELAQIESKRTKGCNHQKREEIMDTMPYRAKIQSSLIEDYIGRTQLYISLVGPSPKAVFYEIDNVELGAVALQGSLMGLQRTGAAGEWNLIDWKLPASGISAVEVAQTPDGGVHLVALTDTQALVYSLEDATPCLVLTVQGSFNTMGVSYTPEQPQRQPFGWLSQHEGNLTLLIWDGAAWSAREIDVKHSINDTCAVVALTPINLVVGMCNQPHFLWCRIDLSKPSGHDVYGPIEEQPSNAARMCGGFQDGWNSAGFVFLGFDQRLYLSRAGAHHAIGDFTCYNASVVRDDRSLMHIYLGQGDSLTWSVLHQTGWGPAGPIWSGPDGNPTPIPIARDVNEISANSLARAHTPIVTYCRTDNDPSPEERVVRVMRQDATTERWSVEEVRLASSHAYKLDRWRSRITLEDKNGRPVRNHAVTLRSATRCVVDVNGMSVALDPREHPEAELSTNAAGVVLLSVDAHGLTPPQLTLSADGLAADVAVQPARQVQEYLAGQGTLFGKQPFSGATLLEAKANGQPLIPTSIWTKELTPDVAVDAMRSVLAIGDPNLTQPEKHGFVIQTAESDQPRFRSFSSAEELQAELARFRTTPRYGGFWDDVSDFFHDVVHGIASAASAVGRIAVDVTNKLVHIVIDVGGKLLELANLAIETFADAVHMVETIFNCLKSTVEAALDWLKNQFPFEQIWNTKKVIDTTVARVPALITPYITAGRQYVDSQLFVRMRGAVDGLFSQAATRFADARVADFDSSSHQPGFLQRTGQQIADLVTWVGGLEDAAIQWLWDHFFGWLPSLSKLIPDIALPGREPILAAFRALTDAFSGVMGKLQTAARGFASWLAEQFSEREDDWRSRFQLVQMDKLFGALKIVVDAAIDGLQAIADSLFALASGALQGIVDLFATPFQLPGISDLYRWLQSAAGISTEAQVEVTLGGIFSLLLAFPATLMWKLLHGADSEMFPSGLAVGRDKKAEGTALLSLGVVASIFNTSIIGLAADVLDAKPLYVTETVDSWLHFWLGTGILFLSVATTVFSWPSAHALPDEPIPLETQGDRWAFANWMWGWITPMVDFGFMVLSAALPDKDKRHGWRISRFVDGIGLFVDMVMGLGNLITGIGESVTRRPDGHPENEHQIVANVILPLLAITQFLRTGYIESFGDAIEAPWLGPVCKGTKVVLFDFAIGLTGSICKVGWIEELNGQEDAVA